MKKKLQVIAARFHPRLIKEVERIADEEKVDKSTVIIRATDRYIRQWKLRKALGLYQQGKVTLWKAAEIAGISLWEIMDVAIKRKIPVQYTAEDFIEDFEAALKE
ncbi:MAG: UPF0175 family protein [Euryarchaeota archaeon]|nr:UPF0175 family protein [Euryarchaeota archaeon]